MLNKEKILTQLSDNVEDCAGLISLKVYYYYENERKLLSNIACAVYEAEPNLIYNFEFESDANDNKYLEFSIEDEDGNYQKLIDAVDEHYEAAAKDVETELTGLDAVAHQYNESNKNVIMYYNLDTKEIFVKEYNTEFDKAYEDYFEIDNCIELKRSRTIDVHLRFATKELIEEAVALKLEHLKDIAEYTEEDKKRNENNEEEFKQMMKEYREEQEKWLRESHDEYVKDMQERQKRLEEEAKSYTFTDEDYF